MADKLSITFPDVWNNAEGNAHLPTICSVKQLQEYHPMNPTSGSPYSVKIQARRSASNGVIRGEYLLELQDTGWSQTARDHVNYSSTNPNKALIFKHGDADGNFLFAKPEDGFELNFKNLFLLKRWEIHIEQVLPNGQIVFVDYLMWQPTRTDIAGLNQSFITSWRWINNLQD